MTPEEEVVSMAEIFAMIPPPIKKIFFLKCPQCGHRTWNCHGAEYMGYDGHYLKHIIDDMKN
jgi:hypothetical protein